MKPSEKLKKRRQLSSNWCDTVGEILDDFNDRIAPKNDAPATALLQAEVLDAMCSPDLVTSEGGDS